MGPVSAGLRMKGQTWIAMLLPLVVVLAGGKVAIAQLEMVAREPEPSGLEQAPLEVFGVSNGAGARDQIIINTGTLSTTEVYLPRITRTPKVAGRMVFHYTPQYILGIAGRVSSDKLFPTGKTIIHTGGLGDLSTRPIPWLVGDFTGFYPEGNPADSQRGVSEGWYGSSAVQLRGYTVGMHIHSYSSPSDDRYKLAQILYAWPQELFPWRYGGKAKLCISHYAALPSSWTGDGSINYAYTAMTVRDMITKKKLWISINHYDSRGDGQLAEFPMWWGEANDPIAMGYYGGQRYSSLLPTSYSSTSQTWDEWRYYGFCISRDQLKTILNDVNDRFDLGFSISPDTYRLELFGIGPEMSTIDGVQGHMSMRVKDVWVFTLIDD